MDLRKIEEIFWKNRRIIVLVATVTVVQIFELALLYYKYSIFTGGFLQPFSYTTLHDRIVFISLSFWFDLIFFSCLDAIWFFIADRLNKIGVAIYYAFVFFTLLVMGAWLSIKFKVLSYFNDALNFQIIKNLGGGSIKEALIYISNELFLFVSIVSVLVIFFIISFRYFKKIDYPRSFEISSKHRKVVFLIIFTSVLITPIITLFVSHDKVLRYGMQKKTSFLIISQVLDTLTDIDFDGFGSVSFPQDMQPFDATIFPGALDIPGNGIDEDGYLGDAILLAPVKDTFNEIPAKVAKNIVLIILESARYDMLEKKIKGKYVAPNTRKLAKAGISVKRAYSHTGYTTSSLKAIFNRNLVNSNQNNLLGFLRRSTYQQSIISGQDESFGNVAEHVGMHKQGVYFFDARIAIHDRVFVSKEAASLRLSEERVIEQFKRRMKELDFNRPQFIYLNFQAAHFPYKHPKMAKRTSQHLISRSDINNENKEWVAETYWNAIANADWAVGEVVKGLVERQALDNTTIVILGDHGESLFDDGFLGHGHAVNDTQTHIPLIISDPNIEIDEVIGQVDVAELMVRSAQGLKNQRKSAHKTVFQLVGSLSQPGLIAHVRGDGSRVTFDFSTEEVFFSDTKEWRYYKDALKDPKYKARVENLIREWEGLRWESHLLSQQSIKHQQPEHHH
ncbi:MAG: sulfatase-like hydrolase/transferase [Methyloprofundus sp.]|nr:sulfatase-like hydrolase/transferase [Methyloprofundus sp.]